MADGFEDDDEQLLEQFLADNDKHTNQGNSSSPNEATKPAPKTFTEAFGFLTSSMNKQAQDENATKKMLSMAPWMNQTQHIVVHPCQKGNPLLDNLSNVSWKFADSSVPPPADYVMTPSSCALFLSLRYHALKPEYIYKRPKHLHNFKTFSSKVLLCLVDVKEPTKAVVELTKACFVVNVTLLLAFSNSEAATYVETFKSYENKPADSIKSKPASSHVSKSSEVLSSVQSVNSTDAHTLLTHFETLSNLAEASEEQLALCPGIGGIKANNIHKLFSQPFLKIKKKKSDSSTS